MVKHEKSPAAERDAAGACSPQGTPGSPQRCRAGHAASGALRARWPWAPGAALGSQVTARSRATCPSPSLSFVLSQSPVGGGGPAQVLQL